MALRNMLSSNYQINCKNMSHKLLAFLLVFSFVANAQLIFKNPQQKHLSFKELQQQFAEFKKQNDVTKVKSWKHFKRWEADMQLHTNTLGEPAGFDTYVNETINAANTKQQQQLSGASGIWTPFGPNVLPDNLTGYMENGIGRINCIAFHPTNANTYFVGVAQGGVWKTTNNGVSWTPLTDNLPITRISDISIDPVNPDIMFISVCDFEYVGISLFLSGRKRHTHYGLGVYKTTDGGNTWAPTGLSYQLTNGDESLIRKILINPNNTNEILACGVNGMHKSTNGGASWTKQLDSLFWDMLPDPTNPNVIYAATGWVLNSNQGSAGIYKSTNFGNTWIKLTTGIPVTGSVQRVKLAIAPSDNNYIYALCVNTQNGLYGFYKSINAGVNWSYISPTKNILEGGQGTGSGGQGNYDLGLLVDPTDKNIVYAAGVNLWGSTDGAQTFAPVSHWTLSNGATIHGDIHFLDRNHLSGEYFVCTDGGLYKSNNIIMSDWNSGAWPTVWTHLNNGIQITSFYRLSSSKTMDGRLCAGAQDNATFYYKNGAWSTIFGGDGMDNYLDPTDNFGVIGSSQYGNFYHSVDDGNSSLALGSNIGSEQSEWVTPIAADYNNPGTLYVGHENVVMSNDGGNSWNALTQFPGLPQTEVSALAVSASNSSVLYAAKRVRYELGIPSLLFKSTDAGLNWTDVTIGLPDSLYFTGVEINETNANNVYVCMAGFSAGNKVFTTNDGGTSWQNISYNLPNIPINCIKQIPGTNQLIAATDIGAYVLDLSLNNWVSNSLGLPNVIVSDIEFNPSLNKAYISTFGRGIWETNLNVLTGVNNINIGQLMTFNLYPSINSGSFTIELVNEKDCTFELIDVMGKVVFKQELNSAKQQFNLKLASGVYYARISDKKRIGVKKFVVE